MRWNWQLPDWPHFQYDTAPLQPLEARFLKGAGVVVGALHHLDNDTRQAFTLELISQEMVDSSAIEGEVLDRASVQSSLAKQLGFAADPRRANAKEAGAAELMADLYRSYAKPLDDQTLFDWHRMLMKGDRSIETIGAYRTHADEMQIVSGTLHAPKVHFEAPPSAQVPDEMRRFLLWFNESAPGGAKLVSAITRAAVAHLWFETIHPFEDGNGRLGRAIAEKALAQSLEMPTLTVLAETIRRNRKSYYEELHRASRTNQIDAWLTWVANIVLEAQERTIGKVRFLIEKAKLFDRLKGQINERQERALLRMFAEGPDGFKGGLSAGNYQTITGATSATATRDLAALVELGALNREGERRYARYNLEVE